ncbi:MAG: hypothetical protein ACD_3C00016G0001 [uncultured bacterium (gcode 4)]|uniref:Uncharacterized protein n=1 Tax=uncultured bacterium (gcode 4) TaxID=1234023 RepID=K2G380_9BACT|nr:MAG: hypothetical protein ACD_3C00016G0001 [uncultured bacterium (gcode 4)]
MTFLDRVFWMSLYAESHRVHWFHIVHPEYVKDVGLSGAGYSQDHTLYISIHFFMDDMSDNLVESLAPQDWEEKERNAMVASIARITMTTMSSTRVKANRCLLFIIYFIFYEIDNHNFFTLMIQFTVNLS